MLNELSILSIWTSQYTIYPQKMQKSISELQTDSSKNASKPEGNCWFNQLKGRVAAPLSSLLS
jgi:hypothetical protein